jgi:hypothetical protein
VAGANATDCVQLDGGQLAVIYSDANETYNSYMAPFNIYSQPIQEGGANRYRLS